MNRRQLFGAVTAAVMGLWSGQAGQGRELARHNIWAELSTAADKLADTLLALPEDAQRAELERLRHGNKVLYVLVASRLAGLHKRAR